MNGKLAHVTVGQATHVGMVRSENQDSLAYAESPTPEQKASLGNLWLVCDGMGGAAGGATASGMAVELISREYMADKSGSPDSAIQHAIKVANREIWDRAQRVPELRGMGTTAVAVAIVGDVAYVGNVGDSRAYVARDSQIFQITQDHSIVSDMQRQGLLSMAEAEAHPESNVITRSLGAAQTVEVETYKYGLGNGDRILLCSDGLSNQVKPHEMLEVLKAMEPGEACWRLVEMANQRGGPDNITVQVVRIDELPDPDAAEDALDPRSGLRRTALTGKRPSPEAAPDGPLLSPEWRQEALRGSAPQAMSQNRLGLWLRSRRVRVGLLGTIIPLMVIGIVALLGRGKPQPALDLTETARSQPLVWMDSVEVPVGSSEFGTWGAPEEHLCWIKASQIDCADQAPFKPAGQTFRRLGQGRGSLPVALAGAANGNPGWFLVDWNQTGHAEPNLKSLDLDASDPHDRLYASSPELLWRLTAAGELKAGRKDRTTAKLTWERVLETVKNIGLIDDTRISALLCGSSAPSATCEVRILGVRESKAEAKSTALPWDEEHVGAYLAADVLPTERLVGIGVRGIAIVEKDGRVIGRYAYPDGFRAKEALAGDRVVYLISADAPRPRALRLRFLPAALDPGAVP